MHYSTESVFASSEYTTLKALYQHIADKNRNHDVFCIFLGQENGIVRIRAPHIAVL